MGVMKLFAVESLENFEHVLRRPPDGCPVPADDHGPFEQDRFFGYGLGDGFRRTCVAKAGVFVSCFFVAYEGPGFLVQCTALRLDLLGGGRGL